MPIQTTPRELLPQSLMASWGVGGLGTTSLLYLINMFVVFFLVRHVGIPAAIAGALLAVTRIYDALLNPVIGTLSDHSVSRWGRRRPWMLAGAVVAPLGVIAVFNPPALAPGPELYAAVLGALLLYCTGYSLFAIPHVALGAEMTDDYRARATLMAWRTFFVYVSGIVITAGAPALVAKLGGDHAAYSSMSWAAAAVVAGTMLWVVASTGRARVTQRSTTKVPAMRSLRTALSNRPFVIILVTKMMGQLGTAFTGAAMLFFFADVLHRGESALAVLGLASNLVGVATVPVWSRVLRSVERRTLLITLQCCNVLTYVSWLAASPEEPQLLFILRAIALGACGSGSVLVLMAMLADTIELDRLKTGQRREGMFVGAFELMQTTSFVIGPLVAGLALSAAGLVPGLAGRAAQPESALQMMRIAMSVIPAVCSLLALTLVLLYRLDAATLARLRVTAAAPAEADAPAVAAAQVSPPSPPAPPAPPSINASASCAVLTGSSSTSI